ncbi:MAG: alpha/beta hydrolase [Woeseia sp.]
MNTKRLALVLAVILASALAGCNDSPPAQSASPVAAPTDGLEPGSHSFTTADGEQMPYDVNGGGDITVVFVHCWMCNRTFWSEQVPVVSRQYRTVTVDLPGHGEATSGRDVWRVGDYGRDVAALIESLDLSDVVLVGHSMGGPVALRAASLAGDRVLGIVAVDTLHNADFEFSGEQMDNFMAAFEADFTGTCANFVQAMFRDDDPAQVENTVREASCRDERAAAGTALMRDFGTIDMPQWFRQAGVPIRAINAATPNPTRTEANRKYADFDVVLMDDVGHYLQMTHPDEFNPLLMAAISDLVEPATGGTD